MATPWGMSDSLRDRKLRPGPGIPREAVVESQLERLYAAMTAAVTELGYEKTRVADLVALSGVSRCAFYQHFSDKRGCFLATLQETRLQAIASADREDLDATIAFADAYPASARLLLYETHAAGARDDVDDSLATRAEMLEAEWEVAPDIAYAIVAGGARVLEQRLTDRFPIDQVLADELRRWAASYRGAPSLPRTRRRSRLVVAEGERESADRIHDAVTMLVAERGYRALTVVEIAQRAHVSLSTFYALHEGKDDAVISALEGWAAAARASSAAATDTFTGVDEMLNFFASHPAAARLVFLEAHGPGDRGAQVGDVFGSGWLTWLSSDPTLLQATAAAIHALVAREVRARRTERLRELAPTATFLALAPIVGASEAAAAARQDTQAVAAA